MRVISYLNIRINFSDTTGVHKMNEYLKARLETLNLSFPRYFTMHDEDQTPSLSI